MDAFINFLQDTGFYLVTQGDGWKNLVMLIVSCFLLYSSAFPPRKRCALVVLLPLLFWASFLIGPVSNMRYVFPLFSLYPILLCTALLPKRMFEK